MSSREAAANSPTVSLVRYEQREEGAAGESLPRSSVLLSQSGAGVGGQNILDLLPVDYIQKDRTI